MNRKEYMREYQKKNKERIKEHQKRWRGNNPLYMKEYQKKWEEINFEHRKKYMEEYFEKRKRDNPEYSKKYYQEHKDAILESQRQRRFNNPEKDRQWRQNHKMEINKYHRERLKIDIKYNLNHKIRTAIWESLKGNKNGRHWESLVGYHLNDLIVHLQKTMPKGYTWQDYLTGKLHIDHIIPISVYNFTKPEHINFKKCWSLNNLQLLPAIENISKGNKLNKPFQLALAI